MTKIEESADVLTISFQRGLTSRFFHLLAAVLLTVFVVRALISDKNDFADGQYPALAMPFLILMGLVSASGAFFLISRAFEQIKYHFDKTADEFCVSGRKYLLKHWMIEGMTSEIVSITNEVRETDDNTTSEIFLKFRSYTNVTETLKCGTRNVSEDNNIADIIERFLKWKNKP